MNTRPEPFARGRMLLAAIPVLLGVLGATWAVSARQEEPFPHERHEGLFPLCIGCHEGIPTGDVPDFYPEATSCAGCHDGVDVVEVSWSGPSERVDNLDFEHSAHAERLIAEGDPAQTCASCHVEPGGGRMSVSAELQLGTCLNCHEHQAEEHFVDADCATCHVPLAETSFALERVEALPVPADHDLPEFLLEDHGVLAGNGTARCATCHTQERCVSCHVDAARAEIVAMPAVREGMDLPVATAHYDEPSSHIDEGWFDEHGGQASRQTCGTCHTSNDCKSCHVASVPDIVESLVSREVSRAPGVVLEPQSPKSHESFFFMDVHAPLAASDASTCSTCHVETFCVECHEGPSTGGYHPMAFVARHASSAFGRTAECATCHNTQAFCRACHTEAGLTRVERLGADYHEGGSLWLIRHGQAARQNLETCASCHAQNDCTTCHSAVGAFKVNPHPLDFDAERAFAKSPRTCAACHFRNPITGREP